MGTLYVSEKSLLVIKKEIVQMMNSTSLKIYWRKLEKLENTLPEVRT